jgi:4-amino-4-deoxy-L-arabinose transferase
MNAKKQYTLLLLLYFLAVYILPLGFRDLLVPDETRFGDIPREMIAGGDWVVPHFNGLRYFEKPPLGYWVHAGSLLLFGENNFAVRFPSALAVGLSALLIYGLVNRASRDTAHENGLPALLAALIFLSCSGVVGVGNIAVLDSLFSFFVTATITAFYYASESPPGSASEKRFLLLAGLACGLAFLTKGFLALAIPVLALVPYLVWQRRYVDMFRMSWLPILCAVLVALPWGIAIHVREPDFWWFFFWNEHIRRYAADNAQHKASFWFFFMTAPIMFIPWTFAIPAAVTGIRKLSLWGPQDRLLRLATCWLVVPFLFFSASRGKLLTYILPIFPPLAILMALGLSPVLGHGNRKVLDWGLAVTGCLFMIILLALIPIQIFGFHGFYLYSQTWKAAMLAIGLLCAALFCLWSLRSQDGMRKLVLLGFSPLLLLFLVHFLIPDSVIEESAPGRLLEKHRDAIRSDTIIIAGEEVVGAACWNFKRNDVYILGPAGEFTYGLNYPDAAGRQLDTKSVIDLIGRNPINTLLIFRTKKMPDLHTVLPQPVFQENTGPNGYELWQY